METQEFFTPEMISGMIGGAMVAVALLFARGVAWLKSFVMTTPTKIDDKAYNALVKAFTDAGVITSDQAAAATVEKPKSGGLKLQASPWATAAAIALLGLSAGGCSSVFDPLQDMGGGIRAGAGASGGAASDGGAGQPEARNTSLLDQMADDIVAAGTSEERALRVCLFSTVAAEVYIYRLLNYGGEAGELEAAYGTVARMAQAVQTLRGQQATLWFETEMFYAAAGIVRAVEGPLRDRALGAVGRVLTQDWRGIARGLRTGAAQAALASAMFRDARNAATAIGEGRVTMAQAWDACQGRLDAKLDQLAGAIGVTPPPTLRMGS